MSFNYDFNGNVLMLPITGKGPGKTEIVKPKFSLEFNLEEYDKDGQKHLKVKGQKFHWEAELLKFNFENLFGGDKALSDNINKVMNENWQPVFEDVGSIKPKFSLSFNLEESDKKGQKYFKVIDQKFSWEPELLTLKFENLFGGDPALGENINKVINENWQVIFQDVGPSYSVALGQIFGAIANGFFGKVSVLELFGEE
ncbi:hypothetical protein GEV33_006006 [Tenebrio molitor]|uniref:Uncharacterized protein n=1 Tax=Tenebrio molitor TaxID=7067 RepID=A0A8J6LDJ5_TENMO|nr:hypothetical protein GEV33_006006 [Tenebrio molitor]